MTKDDESKCLPGALLHGYRRVTENFHAQTGVTRHSALSNSSCRSKHRAQILLRGTTAGPTASGADSNRSKATVECHQSEGAGATYLSCAMRHPIETEYVFKTDQINDQITSNKQIKSIQIRSNRQELINSPRSHMAYPSQEQAASAPVQATPRATPRCHTESQLKGTKEIPSKRKRKRKAAN